MRYHKSNGDEVIMYTNEERERAMKVSLTSLARSLGFTPVRQGAHWFLKEMDSLVIYNDKSWNRWSGRGNITAGSQIDFLMEFGGVSSAAEAIQQLLEFNGERIQEVYAEDNAKKNKPTEFKLPPANKDQRRLFAYLIKTRGLSQEIVHYFVHNKLIYEDAVHHNIVYCGRDPEGVIRYAGLRGTADYNGRTFKMDVPGNDKNYGVNIVNMDSSELKVFEAVIDCMSYMDMYGDKTSNKLILGMVEDNPLAQFLKDYPHIKKIVFCLDNYEIDKAAKKALFGDMEKDENVRKPGLVEKYKELGYEVEVENVPCGKDYNECLLEMKKNPEKVKLLDSHQNEGKPEELISHKIEAAEVKKCLSEMARYGYTLYESKDNLLNPCFVHVGNFKQIGFDGWESVMEELEEWKFFHENGHLRDEYQYMLDLIKEHEKNVPGVALDVLDLNTGELSYRVGKKAFLEAYDKAAEWKKNISSTEFVNMGLPRRARR